MAEPFADPPWDDDLDADAFLRVVPANATIRGMFSSGVVDAVAKKGRRLAAARDRYIKFNDYPLREHMALLVEASGILFPDRSPRQGLRKLGRAAVPIFRESMVGRVMWTQTSDIAGIMDAVCRAFTIVVPSSRARLTESLPGQLRLAFEDVHCFLDCHQVGLIERVLRDAGYQTRVQVRMGSPKDGEFLCTWG